MKLTTFCLVLLAALFWSIFPAGTYAADAAPGAQADIGPLAQMGPGMMQGGRGCPGMGPGNQRQVGAQGSGADIFNAYCAGCHAGGGNSVMPSMPLKGSAPLQSFAVFRDYVRNPRLPNGAQGAMPAFSPGQISNQQMHKLYQFLKSRWGS